MLAGMLRPLLLSVSVLALACSSKPRDPEAEVRAAVEALEEAVEARDVGLVKDLLADGYQDDRRNDKRALVSTLQFLFLRKQSIHVLVTINDIELVGEDRATVALVAAAAGVPIANASVLAKLSSADIFDMRFDMVRDGGDWKVTGAKWKRASGDLSRLFGG